MNNLGYNNFLFILPFDHRLSFIRNLFGVDEKNLNQNQTAKIKELKEVIYEAFKKTISLGLPKEHGAILVDEQFGEDILNDAKKNGFISLLSTEKSGQETFDFEYGEKFGEHIDKYKPTFAKALIRYKPNADWTNLKVLSDYCHEHEYKFLLEMLSGLSVSKAENSIRIIGELRERGIEPDVWKMEGMEKEDDYKSLVAAARRNGRENVGLVILGRGESKEKVEKWIREGAKVKGVIGFAIGRTIFWEPIVKLEKGIITKNQAIDNISRDFFHFYNLFSENAKII